MLDPTKTVELKSCNGLRRCCVLASQRGPAIRAAIWSSAGGGTLNYRTFSAVRMGQKGPPGTAMVIGRQPCFRLASAM